MYIGREPSLWRPTQTTPVCKRMLDKSARKGTLYSVLIADSAHRHGINDDAMLHAIANAIRTVEQSTTEKSVCS